MLRWSYNHFRLHSAPFPDDVTWLNDGIAFLDALRHGGPVGLVRYVSSAGPLDPYAIVATIAFALLGIVDWAPYLLNGWLVFSLLLFLEIARHRMALTVGYWFLGAAVLLAFPCCGYSVVSFVGDHASGIFLAIGITAFLQGWPASKSRLESWTPTIAFVFALFGKGTLFPESIALLFLSSILGYAIAACEQPGTASTQIRRWGLCVLVVLLVTLPYYALVAKSLYSYLTLNNYGSLKAVWAFEGSRVEGLLYYLTGFSGGAMLGPALYLAVVLVALRLALLPKDDRFERMRVFSLLSILAFTYALPTAMANKTPFVGGPFQFLLAITAVMFAWSIIKRMGNRAPVLAVLIAATAMLLFRFPDSLDARNSAAVAARNRTLEGLMTALRAQDLKPDEPVFFTTIGYIGVTTLRYEFLKQHLPLPRFYDLALSNDPAQFKPAIEEASYVIATEEGNDEVYYTAPSAFVQDQTLAMVEQDPAFVEIARFPTWRGKHTYLFGRRDRAKPVALPSAPDPPPPAPVIVKNSGRNFEIDFPAPRGLYARLTLRFRSTRPGLEMETSIPMEDGHGETFADPGEQVFTYRYIIRKHLVAVVPVRFRANHDVSEVEIRSAELIPVNEP